MSDVRRINILTKSGPEPIMAEVHGEWAAHPAADGWRVSHVPTGRALLRRRAWWEAQAAARVLDRECVSVGDEVFTDEEAAAAAGRRVDAVLEPLKKRQRWVLGRRVACERCGSMVAQDDAVSVVYTLDGGKRGATVCAACFAFSGVRDECSCADCQCDDLKALAQREAT